MDLLIVSRDSYTLAKVGLNYSSVFVNDFEHKVDGSYWMHFFVLDAVTGKLNSKVEKSIITAEENIPKLVKFVV